jgi:Gp157 protein
LWAISEELMLLLDSVETCPPELEAELQGRIDLFMGAEVAKVDQIAHVLAALEYEQKAAADEVARLQERKKTAQKAQEKLEAYVCRVIKARGVKKLAGKTNTLSVRPSDAVVIRDEEMIPVAFIVEKVVTTKSIDKAAIKAALKGGVDVPGADLEFRDNLQRK